VTRTSPISELQSPRRKAFRAVGALLLHVLEEQITKKKSLVRKQTIELLMSHALAFDGPDISTLDDGTDLVTHDHNFTDERKANGHGDLAKGNGNLSATWYEWKKTEGKGCFASANLKIAARLVRAASARRLFERPIIRNLSNDEIYDTEIDPERIIACFDLFCGDLRCDEFDWAGSATGTIFSLARIDPADQKAEFVDLTDMATIVVTECGIARPAGYTKNASKQRDALLMAAVDALNAVEALYEDTVECAEFMSIKTSMDMASFRKKNRPLGIVNLPLSNPETEENDIPLVRREATMMEIENEMLYDVSALITKAQWLCRQLYHSNPNVGTTLGSQLLKRMAKELTIASNKKF